MAYGTVLKSIAKSKPSFMKTKKNQTILGYLCLHGLPGCSAYNDSVLLKPIQKAEVQNLGFFCVLHSTCNHQASRMLTPSAKQDQADYENVNIAKSVLNQIYALLKTTLLLGFGG